MRLSSVLSQLATLPELTPPLLPSPPPALTRLVDPTPVDLGTPPTNAPPVLPPAFRPIVVPFPLEARLANVTAAAGAETAATLQHGYAWYYMITDSRIVPPRAPERSRILLHLEAVDWEVQVWVNRAQQVPLGERGGAPSSSLLHRGGSAPVSYDITDSVLGPCASSNSTLCPPGSIEFVIGSACAFFWTGRRRPSPC